MPKNKDNPKTCPISSEKLEKDAYDRYQDGTKRQECEANTSRFHLFFLILYYFLRTPIIYSFICISPFLISSEATMIFKPPSWF